MTAVEIRAEISTYLEDAGLAVTHRDGGLEVAQGDIVEVIRHDEHGYVVESFERGSLEGVDLATPSLEVLERFVILNWAHAWRDAHGMKLLTLPEVPAGTISRVEVDGHGWVVRRCDDEGWLASKLSYGAARELESALRFPVETVIEAVKRPDGDPVWGAGTTVVSSREELGVVEAVGVDVRSFLEGAGIRMTGAGQGLMVDADTVSWEVVQEGEEYVVRVTRRGVPEDVHLRTASLEVLRRFLLVGWADLWRSRRGLEALSLPDRGTDVVVVADEGEDQAVLLAADGSRLAWHMSEVPARMLAAAAGFPVWDVMGAVEHREGHPVWGGGRRWRRR